jgi:hypothetical protein
MGRLLRVYRCAKYSQTSAIVAARSGTIVQKRRESASALS